MVLQSFETEAIHDPVTMSSSAQKRPPTNTTFYYTHIKKQLNT